MNPWDKISLFKFQQIHAIQNRTIPEIDKTLFSTCVVFDMTEFQLDNMPLKDANKYLAKLAKIFSTPFEPEPQTKIGKYEICYNPGSMRFGQFIELFHYLTGDAILMAHKVMASISNEPGKINDSDEHQSKSEYFHKQPILKIIKSLSFFMERYKQFLKEYEWLFGTGTEEGKKVEQDFFNKQYGWMYSAKIVSEYQGINLNAAYDLNVREAFHSLAYLKEKAKYDEKQFKKK